MRRPRADGGESGHPLDETISQSGPGIPDDAAAPGYDPVGDAEAERAVEAHPPSAASLFRGRRD